MLKHFEIEADSLYYPLVSLRNSNIILQFRNISLCGYEGNWISQI